MPMLEPVLSSLATVFVTMNALWSSPVALIPLALAAAYFGWRIVEFIPVTRRILERREGGS
ncbi:hypothetical protein N5079_00610 [Planotetraspora sp. A-T 1434]|uniref:hypothetical protein n=1 Tax=Planotetraspora sp. A-T 1434 TaxID=2979219 RepID=UPI0021BE16A2|nr:hypothetical protein [Planotetraspora sp. A-T 1434]MCT9928711.1 hypothetical protein [Planotetraspora sp. A-T 1434]